MGGGGGVDSNVINNNCNVQVIQLYLAICQHTLLPYNHLKMQWTQVLIMAMDTPEVNSQFHYHHYFCFLSRLIQGLPHVREAVARKFSVVNKAPLTVEVRISSLPPPSSFLCYKSLLLLLSLFSLFVPSSFLGRNNDVIVLRCIGTCSWSVSKCWSKRTGPQARLCFI